jgi:acetyl-CoA carboxylase biotin carboxyl carrier protein
VSKSEKLGSRNRKKAGSSLQKKREKDAGLTEEGGLSRLEKLLKMMEKHDVTELEWDKGGERIKLKTRSNQPEYTGDRFAGSHHLNHSIQAAPLASSSPSTSAPDSSSGAALNQKQILSPFVGTFYRSSSPDADPYCKEGQVIKRGDVLCIIEAMKLMNEIEAELSGKILSILVENGQPVEFGEPLFLIET